MIPARPALVAAALLTFACATSASGERESPPDLRGTWEGQIFAPDAPIIVTLELGNGRMGTMEVRNHPYKNVTVRVVTAPDSTQFVAISDTPFPASFVGVRKGQDITGTFREAGKRYHFWLTRTHRNG
jgi:hypothetical protein